MRKMIGTWLWVFIKRLLTRKAFLGFLLLLPLLAMAVRGIGTHINPSSVEIGIVLPKEDGLAQNTARQLTNLEGAVTFVPYDNEEQMQRDIKQQRVQWGYAFTEDMEESILNGNGNRSIICYETSASFLSKLTDELVFAAMMKQHGETILMDFAENSGILSPRQLQLAKKELPRDYKSYQDGSDTFSFAYKTLDGEMEKSNGITTPIRGICAILILIGGIYGAMMAVENEGLGLTKRLSQKGKAVGRLLAVFAPVILLSLSAYVTLLLTGGSYGIFRECVALVVYGFSVGGFCYFLAMVLYNENALCGTIPILTMGALLCCPIFFDASLFLPVLSVPAKLFLPYYYLKGLYLPLLGIGAVCVLLGGYLSKIKIV